MTVPFEALNATVRKLIEERRTTPGAWSVQGFGMLRTYLDPEKVWRLNIWHSALAVPLCSIIHDHPWDFKSWIMAGVFENVRYHDVIRLHPTHEWQVIQTGEGGGPDGQGGKCALRELPCEFYTSGDEYEQGAREIHASFYRDGTVTLNKRTRLPDGEHARVFWPIGSQWIDAMPRPATPFEIGIATDAALEQMK